MDAPPGVTWAPLISRSYTVDNVSPETYVCRRVKISQDMWISGFRSELPEGTLRAFVSIDTSGATQTGNITPCDGTVGIGAPGVNRAQLLFADTHGPNQYNDILFPAGDAVHIPANSYIVLNADVYEPVDGTPYSGTLNIYATTVPPGEVQHELQAMFGGTNSIDIKSDGTMQTVTGGCSGPRSQDYHVLAVWPHMHMLGKHSHLTITRNNVTDVVEDQPFTFTNQAIDMVNERTLGTQDQLNFTCSYVVPSMTCQYNGSKYCGTVGTCQPDNLCHVGQSDSLGGEACFAALYVWPPPNNAFGCFSGVQPPI
ncbi:MAG: hypothetical protein JO257_10565 [Deltaproteobacteria bacterium]|nr:hypothetical protein [Deltaproteobacteria bacterium]